MWSSVSFLCMIVTVFLSLLGLVMSVLCPVFSLGFSLRLVIREIQKLNGKQKNLVILLKIITGITFGNIL